MEGVLLENATPAHLTDWNANGLAPKCWLEPPDSGALSGAESRRISRALSQVPVMAGSASELPEGANVVPDKSSMSHDEYLKLLEQVSCRDEAPGTARGLCI